MRRNRAGSSDGLDGIEQDDKMRRLESRAIEVEQHMRTAEVQLGQAAAMFQRGELKAWRNALASSIAEAGQAAEVTIPSTAGLDENKASQMVQRITAARERAAVWTEHVLQVLPEPDMKLVVNFRETQQVDAFMPLRWCIGKSTAALLAGEHSRQRGHWVVLSVVHERAGEVDRRVVKLEKMMEYLQFHRAGRHYVYAALVQSPAGDLSGEQRVKLLDRDSPRSYSRPLFVDIDGERLLYKPQFLEQGLSLTLICHTSIEVVVPEQFFAKEPSPRMIRWLHWFLRTPAPDQCALRRKAIFAFTLQPILAIPWLLAKYVLFPPLSIGVNLAWAILATLLGIRPNRQGYGVDWSQVFRPFRGNLKSVWDGDFKPGEGAGISGGSFIMFKPNGNKYRSRWRWLLLPLAHTLLFAAGFSMVFFRGAGLSKSALSGLAVVLAGLLGAVVVLSVSTTLAAVRRRRKSRGVLRRVETARVEEERQATLQQAREEQVRVALQRLSCEVVPLEVSVYALPPERQTIYLHFMRLKARVCLPRRLS